MRVLPYLIALTASFLTLNNAKAQSKQLDKKLLSEKQLTQLHEQAEHRFFSNPDSALLLARQLVQLAVEQEQPKHKIVGLNDIAKVYYIKGAYYHSLTYAAQALQLSRKISYTSGMANALNTRGLILLGQERYKDALPEFKSALKHNLKLRDSTRMGANYFNLGLCYDETGNFKAAMNYLDTAALVAQRCKDWHIALMTLNRKGETSFHAKDYDKALSFYHAALKYDRYQDDWEKTFAYAGIAQSLYAKNDFKEAIEKAKLSYQLAGKLQTRWDMQRAADILSRCYAALNNYEQAYNYLRTSRQYSDSILNESKEQDLNYLHLQEKKAENAELAKVNEINRSTIRRNRIIIIVIGIFLVILILLLVYLQRLVWHKNRLNKALKKSNDAINLQNEELAFHREKLIASNQTKDQVLSVLGHDLRAPFNSMTQAVELIRSNNLDLSEQREVFYLFDNQLNQVTGLVNELLEWAGSQRSGMVIKPEKIDLAAVVAEVTELYFSALESKEIDLINNNEMPVFIEADRPRLKIIIQNLIGNAIKFTPRSGQIQISYSVKQGSVDINIQDNGIGMSSDKLAMLFKVSGRRISQPGTDNEAGTGLGLLLIKQFIDETGGSIHVDSKEGKGSVFTVSFKA